MSVYCLRAVVLVVFGVVSGFSDLGCLLSVCVIVLVVLSVGFVCCVLYLVLCVLFVAV